MINFLTTVSGEKIVEPNLDLALGLGLVLLITGVGAAWAAIHLRGKTSDRLNAPVDLAFAKLTDFAITELRALQTHLNKVLPEENDLPEDDDDNDEPFDPSSMVTDPSSVERPAKRGIRALKDCKIIYREFDWMLIVCSFLKYVAIAFVILVAASSTSYYFTFSNTMLWMWCCRLTVISIGVAAVLLILYATLDARIQKSIEKSKRINRPVGAPRL